MMASDGQTTGQARLDRDTIGSDSIARCDYRVSTHDSTRTDDTISSAL